MQSSDLEIIPDSDPEPEHDRPLPLPPRASPSSLSTTTTTSTRTSLNKSSSIQGRRLPPWELSKPVAPLPSHQEQQPKASTSHSRTISIDSNASITTLSSSSKRGGNKRDLNVTSSSHLEDDQVVGSGIEKAEGSEEAKFGIDRSRLDQEMVKKKKKVKRLHEKANHQFLSAAQLLKSSSSSSSSKMNEPIEDDEGLLKLYEDNVELEAKKMMMKKKRVPRKALDSVGKGKGKEKEEILADDEDEMKMVDSSIEVLEFHSDEEQGFEEEEGISDAASNLRQGLDRFKYGRPTTSSKGKKKRFRYELPMNQPIILPSRDRVRLLDLCPLCELGFSASRTVDWKSGHLKSCALKKDYTSETVRIRIESRLLLLAERIEANRKGTEVKRTLFDRTLGKGQGAKTNLREVTVVGVESIVRSTKKSEVEEMMELQAQLDSEMKKPSVDRVLKEAGMIRKERWENERRESLEREKGEIELGPRATGALRHESASMRQSIVDRANGLLGRKAGTGLTQIVDFDSTTSVNSSTEEAEPSNDMIVVGNENGPPSTQDFPRSNIAHKYHHEPGSKTEVVLLPLNPQHSAVMTKERSKSRSESPESSQGPSSEEPLARGSLWSAAAGKDDQIIRHVVSSPTSSSIGGVSFDEPLLPLSPHQQQRTAIGSLEVQQDSPTRVLRSSMTLLGLESPERHSDSSRSQREDGEEMVVDEAQDYGWEDQVDDGVLVWEGTEEKESGVREVAEDESSEDEPLSISAPRFMSTPQKALRARSTPSSISSPSSAFSSEEEAPIVYSPQNRPPNCPDYASFTLGELQKEVAKFGFRISKEKNVLVDQLIKVWIALHPSDISATPIKKKRVINPRKKGKKKGDDGDGAVEEGETRTVEERMRIAVFENEALYLKLLKYEPIRFEDVVNLAVQAKIKAAKPVLSKWLDDQCISYYTQNPIGGTRRRYK